MSSVATKFLLPSARLSNKGLWTGVYIFLTVCLFFLRVVLFTASYGSIEQDSGWYLGVAKNLAHRGIYASYINTIVVEGAGFHPSVRRGISVQDEDGFSYFPIGVTVGPGYVFPQALLLKIFGDGWWQYRLWPLVTYAGLLLFLFYFVWMLGGIWALVIFQIWLWAIPQMTTTLAYEAFSEHIALFYLLGGYLLFLKAFESEKQNTLMFLAGCFLSLAVLTKLLFLLALSGFVPAILWEGYVYRREPRKVLLKWMSLFVGFILPVLLFELYRYMAIAPTFGVEAWKTVIKNNRLEFIYGGSGLHSFDSLNWDFVRQKLMVWADVAMKEYQILWILFLVSPVLLIGRIEKKYWIIVVVMYCAALTSFLWFVFISNYGWARHAWNALLLAMMIISVGFGVTLQAKVVDWSKKSILSLLVVLLAITLVVSFDRVELKPLLDNKTIDKWHQTRSYRKKGILLLGLPHAAIFSFSEQQQTVSFLRTNISEADRIYHVDRFFVAEMATLIDKVFYPMGRYFNNNSQNPDGGESYLIIGPYQQGRWAFTADGYSEDRKRKYCDSVIFSNESYMVCRLKKNVNNE